MMAAMDREAAFTMLGLEPGTKAELIEEACERKWKIAHDLMRNAPSDLLREVYSLELAQIEEAREIVLGRSATSASDRGATKLRDYLSPIAVMSHYGVPVDSETAAHATLGPGKILSERYIILKLIGTGGMGVVYEAFDRVRSHKIAIKVMFPELMAKAEAPGRFHAEAKIVSDLSHPHIVNIYEAQSEGDLYFLTMELLKGKTLRQEMEERVWARQTFSVEDVKRVGRCLSDALEYVHQFTIHRNIKPENIWVAPDGTLKLMDFGLAGLMSPGRFTRTAAAMDTAYYMAPEVLKGTKDVDRRIDQFSVATVLYEMLTEKVPVGRIEPANKVRPDVPQTLSRCLDRALSSRPEARFKDMKAFRDALLDVSKAKMGDSGRPQQIPTMEKSIATPRLAIVGLCLIAATTLATSPWWWTALSDRLKLPPYERSVARENVAPADKKPAEALKAFQAALSSKPDDMAVREGQDKPRNGAARAQEIENKSVPLMEHGRSAPHQEKWSDAASAFRDALEIKPTDIAGQQSLAEAQGRYDVGRRDQAIENEYATAMERGRLALHQERWSDTASAFRDALEKKPTDIAGQQSLAAAQRGHDKARDEDYRTFSEEMWRGRMALRLQRWTDAIEAFQKAVKIDPNAMSAQQYLEEAETGYDKARQNQEVEEKYAAAMERGRMALNQEKWGDAIAAYRDALKFKPRDRIGTVGLNKAEKGWQATKQ